MSRARGKKPSELPCLRHTSAPVRGFSKIQDHGSFSDITSPYPHYVRREAQTELIPRPRPGIVGPEIDYSARCAHFPMSFIATVRERGPSELKKLFLLGKDREYNSDGTPKTLSGRQRTTYSSAEEYARTRPPKGFSRNYPHWTDRDLAVWTAFAYAYGIRFKGDRFYDFPSSLLGESHRHIYYAAPSWPQPGNVPLSKAEFLLLKASGSITHKRSEWARIRRAARKAKRQALITPVTPDKLFVRRREISAKEIRTRYHLSGRDIPFQVFASQFESRITLFPERCRMTIPPIVYKSLKVIYSRPKVIGKLWFQESGTLSDGLKYALDIPRLPKSSIYLALRDHLPVRKDGRIDSISLDVFERTGRRSAHHQGLFSRPVADRYLQERRMNILRKIREDRLEVMASW